MKKLIFSLLVILVGWLLFGCKSKTDSVKIECYNFHPDGAPPEISVYYYLIPNKDRTYFYYYASPEKVTDFSTATWTASPTLPQEMAGRKPTSEIEEPRSEFSNGFEKADN